MSVRIIQGDVRERLAELPADYFDCIVTSPPYFGLRDFGTATWEDGDPECDHAPRAKLRGTLEGGEPASSRDKPGGNCKRCGAHRVDAQIGIEPTLDAYLETMVGVCRELRRVLKPSGVMFFNVADSYSNKQLYLMPQRLCILLQEDGWFVRSHIVWAKKNPMPESVTDRPTSAHETIYMLTKSARYFWDAEAVAERAIYAGDVKKTNGNDGMDSGYDGNRTRDGFRRGITVGETRNLRNVWSCASQPFQGAHFATMPTEIAERCIKAGCPRNGHVLDPFAGSGTTGLVADRLGRDCTLIDLNTSYAEMAMNRIKDDAPLFADVSCRSIIEEGRAR